MRVTMSFTAASLVQLAGCSCGNAIEPPPKWPWYDLPEHNRTNAPLAHQLHQRVGTASAQLIQQQLEEDLEVIGPSGTRVREPVRLEAVSELRRKVYLDFNEGVGWYTVRMRMREDAVYYNCREVRPDICEANLLAGAMEPGINYLGLGAALDGSGDASVMIEYSELVSHRYDALAHEMFELYDSAGEQVECGPYVYVSPDPDDPHEIPPEEWPESEPSADGMARRTKFFFQCDRERSLDVSAIKLVDPPWSEDLSVRASFPPKDEMWTMDLVQIDSDTAYGRYWRPDRRGFSEHVYAARTDELARGSGELQGEAPELGCGASVAGSGRPAVAVMLLLGLLLGRAWPRRGPRPPTPPWGCA